MNYPLMSSRIFFQHRSPQLNYFTLILVQNKCYLIIKLFSVDIISHENENGIVYC